ncbi:uncharacterized protein LOC135359986 [Latimeria chalumnae]|uniref:uncharacterized protein LOC135359986 n=1 Tax=Latimeria chalumnae TaxID=7897 RepID=UPI00313E0DF0
MEAAKQKKPPGFRHCIECSSSYPAADKHRRCLKCLGPRHLPWVCKVCQAMGSRALKCRVLRHQELFPEAPLSLTPKRSSGSRGLAELDPDPAAGVSRSSVDLETEFQSPRASMTPRKASSKRSAPASDAGSSVSGAASVPRPRAEPEAPAPTGSGAASAVVGARGSPRARGTRFPSPDASRHPGQEVLTRSEPSRRHRHGSRQHRHHSRHRSDPMLGDFLEAMMVRLESLEALSRTLPETALPAPLSLASLVPASPSQASMSESRAPTSDPAPLASVSDPGAPGPSSGPSTSRAAIGSSDPTLATPPQAGPSGVGLPHAASVEGDSGETWCEAEGLQSGEVSAAFYTSTSTDSEQGGATDPPAQDANFRGLLEKMAGVLTLELSAVSETDRSRFMQVLQGRSVRAPLQIPLHDVVPATVLDICRAPASVPPVNKRVDRRYLAPDGEGIPLSSHPSAESTIASAANEQARTQRIFSAAPPSQDARRWDALGKVVYSASLGVKVSSYLAHLAQYDHDLWDEVARLSELVPEDRREDVRCLVEDGSEMSRALMQGALDACDTAARGLAAGVSIRRRAWLKGSGFSAEVQQRMDL